MGSAPNGPWQKEMFGKYLSDWLGQKYMKIG
jgi:hypothetical protein